MQITKIGRRTSGGGTTATDGWLNFYFDEPFVLGSQYRVTSVYARFYKIRSASGKFTGDVPIRVDTSGGKYDLGEITGYTFPASTETNGTTISGYLNTAQSVKDALASVSIERIDLGQSTYNGGKDIRCLDSSTVEFILDYENASTNCKPPSNPRLSASQASGEVTLSWDAGSSGTNNTATGYVVTYQDSTNGYTWSEVDYCGKTDNVYDTSLPVYPPDAEGHYRRFGVQTVGTAGWNYYSDVVWSGTLQKISYSPCKGPTWCKLDTTFSAGETTVLRWNAGTPGQNNPIAQYDVWCIQIDENYNVINDWTPIAHTRSDEFETYVRPPETPGTAYGFWVHAVGQNGSTVGSDEEGCLSENVLIRVTPCTGPTWCALDTTYSKGEGVWLHWDEGTAGVYNPILGYAVMRFEMTTPEDEWPPPEEWEAVEFVTGTSLLVYPPETEGHAYVYYVWVAGQNYQAYSFDEICACENPLIREAATNTIKYYTGSGWIDCIVYYCSGSEWVECIPHYCDGYSWIECSST